MAEGSDTNRSEQVSEAPHDSESIKREKIVSIIKRVFKSNGTKLRDAVKGSLSDFSNKLLEKNLITQAAKEKEDYEVVIREVDSIWNILLNVESLQVKLKEFLSVLMDLSGPPAMAGEVLRDLIQRQVNQVLPDVHFLSSTKCGRSASTPGNVVGIKPKINRNAYSMQDTRSFRTEDSFIEETNNSHDSSFTAKTETDDNPIFIEPKAVWENGDKNSQFTSPSLLRPTKPPTTLSNHQNMVFPNGKLPNNIALSTSTPNLDSRHSIDSGVPMSKMNSPQDVEVKPLNLELAKAGGMSDSFLGSGMRPIQPVSDQQHSEATERVLNVTGTYHPSSSQQLSSTSESSMSDMYAFRVDMNYERRKREEADEKREKANKKREMADKKRIRADKGREKAYEKLLLVEEEAKKLKTNIKDLNTKLKEEREEKELLRNRLKPFEDGGAVIYSELIGLNKQRMEFHRTKQEFHLKQEKEEAEMEKKWSELNKSQSQLIEKMSAFEEVKAEQDIRESMLEQDREEVISQRVQVEEGRLSHEEYFKQEESKLKKEKDELTRQKSSFEQEMLQRENSFNEEMEQKRYEHDEECKEIIQANKESNHKLHILIETETMKLRKDRVNLHRYHSFLSFCTRVLLLFYLYFATIYF